MASKKTPTKADRMTGVRARLKGSSRRPAPIIQWFQDNPEAADIRDLWFEMRASGESTRSVSYLRSELAEGFEFPFTVNSLQQHLQRNHLEEYNRAMGSM